MNNWINWSLFSDYRPGGLGGKGQGVKGGPPRVGGRPHEAVEFWSWGSNISEHINLWSVYNIQSLITILGGLGGHGEGVQSRPLQVGGGPLERHRKVSWIPLYAIERDWPLCFWPIPLFCLTHSTLWARCTRSPWSRGSWSWTSSIAWIPMYAIDGDQQLYLQALTKFFVEGHH
jgi:hypothetical protein